ncbi:hypothetical protein GGX14DRAFT_395798 [Mycena pura]|uniref:Uncharacterized protein n=1 Tax=Mycena pura TaxID=153505 RepID=A0AAD6Y9I7_9AGAR|nr:hypothetical protein GGX14DRAFT_395798 [Mycena pura]
MPRRLGHAHWLNHPSRQWTCGPGREATVSRVVLSGDGWMMGSCFGVSDAADSGAGFGGRREPELSADRGDEPDISAFSFPTSTQRAETSKGYPGRDSGTRCWLADMDSGGMKQVLNIVFRCFLVFTGASHGCANQFPKVDIPLGQ